MQTLEVVAAIICCGGRYLATQRGYGRYEGFWEFPGGKVGKGETREQALVREIQEELGAVVQVGQQRALITSDYPDFRLHLYAYDCQLLSEKLELREHKDARWLESKELADLNWLPADRELILQCGL